MIKITNTENLAGVTVSGDYADMEILLDALYEITIDEDDENTDRYDTMSTRVLSLAYDVRHAIQGDRDLEFVDNGIDRQKMIQQGLLAHEKNVYYTCNVYYPELMFEMLAINELIKIRMNRISIPKNDYEKPFNKMVVWDETISVLRVFQSGVVKAVKEVLTDSTFKRWINVMSQKYGSMCNILNPFLDMQNIQYLEMTREQREKKLSIISKRIAEYDTNKDFLEMNAEMTAYCREFRVPIDNIKLEGMDYPEDIEW